MSTPFEVTADGIRIAGRLRRSADHRAPLIVALHGGSYTSAYFDIPGHSLLDIATANGFSVLALDRPCYGQSGAISGQPISFEASAEILDTAIQVACDLLNPRHGVVLCAHSIGGAIALILAARQPSWPLLGVSATGIGDVLPPGVAEAWNSMPPGQPVEFVIEQRRQFMYGPAATFDPEVIGAAEVSAAPIPLEELLEVVGGWIRAVPAVAAEIRVPVQHVLAEYDGLWIANPATVSAFGARFTSAPFVESTLFRGAGHNIDHHHLGRALHLSQLAFALRCAGEQSRPEQ